MTGHLPGMPADLDTNPVLQLLEREILDAHAAGDKVRLARLYWQAAQLHAETGDESRSAFFYVNAYVYALDAGDHGVAAVCHTALKTLGREE